MMRVPVVLEDLCGRRIPSHANIDATRVVVGLIPFGALVFTRTNDVTTVGDRIYRQVDERGDSTPANGRSTAEGLPV